MPLLPAAAVSWWCGVKTLRCWLDSSGLTKERFAQRAPRGRTAGPAQGELQQDCAVRRARKKDLFCAVAVL